MRNLKVPIQGAIDELEHEFKLLAAKYRREKREAPVAAITTTAAQDGRPTQGFGEWVRTIGLNDILALPFIYGMIFPLVVLDLSVTGYQSICFRLFNIQRIQKADYMGLERHRLPYLNRLERFNCDYCGYANGLVAFTREVLARTEQYFCPIKHAGRVLGVHDRYALFLKPGDYDAYDAKLAALRAAVAAGNA